MKYIRTKYGIWKLDELCCVHHPYNNMTIHKSYLEVVSEADTIEELCDELVIDNPETWEKKPFVVGIVWEEFLNKDSAKYQKENNIKLFGAIWTDKGLIYVAKMNDKGELELL